MGCRKSTNTLELDTRLEKATLRVKYSMPVKVLPGHYSIIHEILRACPSSPEAITASITRQLSSLQPGLPLLPPMVATHKTREAEGFVSGSLRIDESRALIIQLSSIIH